MDAGINGETRNNCTASWVTLHSSMKSTKVQTLGAVALRATTACTDEASIIGLSSLHWGKV